MDHPNIAKVFDGGTTPAGQPFFVMELVKGVPITDFCDQNHVPPRQRLDLFLAVLSAVQHAHQKGIIHRDLKPSNVLVSRHDATPVVKVIDFGIAKALGQTLTDKTVFTGAAQMVGTPLYMSPEQAGMSDLDVDTRSDVYSLGVLLYELLTGTTPFDKARFRRAAYDEIRRIIREEDPPRPSTRLSESKDSLPSVAAQRQTEPAKLTRLVRGELDWIVMKALEKDRARRYDTANGFAMDVQRYLADEPVLACPPSAGYRLRKFARRNRPRLAVAAVLGLAVMGVVGGMGWAIRDREARRAQVAGRVESIFAEVDRLEAEQRWPEALGAARRAEPAVAGGDADPATTGRVHQRLRDLEFIDRLERIRLDEARLVDGRFTPAWTDRDYARAFREFGVDIDELPVETSIDRLTARPATAVVLAANLDDWAFVRRKLADAEVARWTRLVAVARGIDPDPLRDRLRAAWGRPIADVRDDLRRLADSIDARAQHPATLLILARTLGSVQQPDAVLRTLRDAQRAHPGDYWLNAELGYVLYWQRDYEGAVRFHSVALALKPRDAPAHNNLGLNLKAKNKVDEAVVCYERAIELDPQFAAAYVNLGTARLRQQKVPEAVAACHKAIELDPRFAKAHYALGNALQAQNKPDEAIDSYKKALEFDPNFAAAYVRLGNTLADQKKLNEAADAYHKAIEIDANDAIAHHDLGLTLRQQRKLPEAVAALRKAIEIDPNLASAYVALGDAMGEQKKVTEAVAAYRKAIELDPNYAGAYINLGAVLCDRLNDYGKAEEAFRKAITLDPKRASAHFNLGNALRGKGQVDEAIVCYRRAIDLDPKDADAHSSLGVVLCDGLKDYTKAEEAFRKAIKLDPANAAVHFNLGNALRGKGQVDEAIACYRTAIDLNPNLAVAHKILGVALHSQKKLDAAIAAYRRAIERSPNPKFTADAYLRIGTALDEQGSLHEAFACIRKAVELDPKHAFAHYYLARLLTTCREEKLRDAPRGLEAAWKTVELAPQSGLAWTVLGMAHYRLGEWKAGIKALEKACALYDPKGGDAAQWFFLAMAHWQNGERDEAREWYARASRWTDKHGPENELFSRFRAEAAALLELTEKK
jgi:tetratricopeptide (TPR) repeat protein